MFFIYVILIAAGIIIGTSLIGNERRLFVDIGFPLNYKDSEVAYWVAYVFLSTEIVVHLMYVFCSLLMWYLLFSCSLRYKELGGRLKIICAGKDSQ